MNNLPSDYIAPQNLVPSLRKQGGFVSNTVELTDGSSQVIEIPLCYLATTADITLSGLQTIDTVVTPEGMFILVKDQSDKKENGIYFAQSGDWERWDGLRAGMLVTVRHGSVNNDTVWLCINEVVEFGVTNIEFEAVGGGVDEKVKISSNDTTENYLNSKISVLRGLVKSVTSPSGNEGLQLAMPAGTTNHILRYDGTNWIATELIQISATNPAGQYLMTFDGTSFFLGRSGGSLSTRYWFRLDTDNGVAMGTGGTYAVRAYIDGGQQQLFMQSQGFGVEINGQIRSKFLAGTGIRPVYSNSIGQLINHTNFLSVAQIADISDNSATYQSSDLVFMSAATQQRIIYQLHLTSGTFQSVKLLLNTADTGMTATATIRRSGSSDTISQYNGSTGNLFHNLSYGEHVSVPIGIATNMMVELDVILVGTSSTIVTLMFSQESADGSNPVTLKEKSRMIMNR